METVVPPSQQLSGAAPQVIAQFREGVFTAFTPEGEAFRSSTLERAARGEIVDIQILSPQVTLQTPSTPSIETTPEPDRPLQGQANGCTWDFNNNGVCEIVARVERAIETSSVLRSDTVDSIRFNCDYTRLNDCTHTVSSQRNGSVVVSVSGTSPSLVFGTIGVSSGYTVGWERQVDSSTTSKPGVVVCYKVLMFSDYKSGYYLHRMDETFNFVNRVVGYYAIGMYWNAKVPRYSERGWYAC